MFVQRNQEFTYITDFEKVVFGHFCKPKQLIFRNLGIRIVHVFTQRGELLPTYRLPRYKSSRGASQDWGNL